MFGSLSTDGIVAGIISGVASTVVTAAVVARTFAKWYTRPFRPPAEVTVRALEDIRQKVTANGGTDRTSVATLVLLVEKQLDVTNALLTRLVRTMGERRR